MNPCPRHPYQPGLGAGSGGFREIAIGPLLAVVTIGLVLILAAGHFFLGRREDSPAG